MYNLNHLPLIDFRDWKVGSDMDPEGGGEAKIYLTFRNNETGEEQEVLSPDYPWQDSVWTSQWEFVDQRVDDSGVLKKHDLMIEDRFGTEVTDAYINNPDYQFFIIAYDLNTTDREAFNRINELFRDADEAGYSMIAITSSIPEKVDEFNASIAAVRPFEFFYSDDVVLKTIIRANPGLLLMKDGIILGKWHYNDIPEYSDIEEEFMKN